MRLERIGLKFGVPLKRLPKKNERDKLKTMNFNISAIVLIGFMVVAVFGSRKNSPTAP